MTHEFLTQFTSTASIDVSRQELEAIRKRPDKIVSLFVSHFRDKVVDMIDRPRFSRRRVGVPFLGY